MPVRVSDWMPPHVLWRSARAKALVQLGRIEDAVALAQEAVALAKASDGLNMHADALLDQAEVLHASNRDEDAARSVNGAWQLYERKGNIVMAARARHLGEMLDRPPILQRD
jgi:hypothetical protein